MNSPASQSKPILGKPDYVLKNPSVTLTQEQFELLVITSEDLRYLAHLVKEDVIDSAPALRTVSTTLRRLLCEGDLHKAVKLAGWDKPLSVKTRLLHYENPQGCVLVTCGGGRWGSDRMPDSATVFGGEGIELPPKTWSFEEDVEVDLGKYLKTLAFAILGVKVRRSDIITYVANKKAAHVSDDRDKPAHKVLDHLWHGLTVTRVDRHGNAETLNAVYLELLSILIAVVESSSVQEFAHWLLRWLNSYRPVWGRDTKEFFTQFPITPLASTT